MAKGRITIVVSVEIDTDDDTPMSHVVEKLNPIAVISHDVIMLETSDEYGVSKPFVEEVGPSRYD